MHHIKSLLLFIFLIGYSFTSQASTLLCKDVFITEGDNQMKLLRNCGKPDFSEWNVIGGNMTYNVYYDNKKDFDYRIIIVNGIITEIDGSIKGL